MADNGGYYHRGGLRGRPWQIVPATSPDGKSTLVS